MELQKLLGFVDLIHRFQRIERRLPRVGEERRENDVEHSYQLALTAWYLNDANGYGMDVDKLLRYALVHDLVEVYAGDTYAYTTDAHERATKDAREAAAAKQIAEEFPEFPELHATIHEYEKREDREARFVYALDKLMPIFGNYMDGGRMWRLEGVTLRMLKDYKTDKIAESPEVNKYFQEILAVMEAQPGLFPTPEL